MALLEAAAMTLMLYLPPARFDHPFAGTIEMKWTTSEQIQVYCPGTDGVACILSSSPEHCVIAFNVDYMIEYDLIMRHERGHCNGWPSTHPR
jgi:hypothetical protein